MRRFNPAKLLLFILAGAMATAFWLWVAPEVQARAGGGGGYGGGGSGGGGGLDIGWLIYLCFRYPQVGVPVLIVVIVVFYYGQRAGVGAYKGGVIRRGQRALISNQKHRAIQGIKESDPAFSAKAFETRVHTAFHKIQKAWFEQDLEPLRAFVSDGIFERFSLQVAEQKDLGYRNAMENISVLGSAIVDVIIDKHFDTLTVRISASATDYRVSLEDGKEIRGSRLPEEQFTEYWGFLRRRGAQTPKGDGLIEGSCPNCGSAIDMNQSAKCSSCQSLLRSGQYDWVLSEITQSCEWRGSVAKISVGVEEYQKKDPDFNLQHIEDRASVMFWRRAMADRLGKVEPLSKLASTKFCESYASKLQPQGLDDERWFYGDCAVGAVNTKGVVESEDWDRALVEVRWAGTRFVTRDGSTRSRGEPTRRRSLFVLARRAGETSDIDHAVTSAHCPACGAPETLTAHHACQYCGEVLNDGSTDWVLTDVLAVYSHEAQELLTQLRKIPLVQEEAGLEEDGFASPPGSADVMAWMVKIALADGIVDAKERKILEQLAAACDIPVRQLDAMLEAAGNNTLEVLEPDSSKEAAEWIGALAEIALADGHLHKKEIGVMRQIGASFGMVDIDVQRLIRRRRQALFQKSRDALRDRRRRRQGGKTAGVAK